jgi:TDG/mug DNA glycosylase family protein
MQDIITAFPPILPKNPHTLILGTMPGGRSLELNQYYAHPQNQFWRFMGDIYGAGRELPYERRVDILKARGIAVWDVVKSCVRQGSMDSNIKKEVVNDFEEFFRNNPSVKLVVFDSLVAEKLYMKHVIPTLSKELRYVRVPSPSPAHASLPYSEKLALWKDALGKNGHPFK